MRQAAPSAAKMPSTTKRPRGGRPPSGRAGEVDARILDAASELFLARGFEGTSCDQIAVLARAGKASIYARYPNKEALFAAVVRRDLERGLSDGPPVPANRSVEGRLAAVGTELARQALRPGAVALVRLVVAEAGRFPALALQADAILREGSVRRVAQAITGPTASPDMVERAMPVAVTFADMTIVPLQMRALLGEDLAALGADVASRVEAAAAMLATTGRLDEWS